MVARRFPGSQGNLLPPAPGPDVHKPPSHPTSKRFQVDPLTDPRGDQGPFGTSTRCSMIRPRQCVWTRHEAGPAGQPMHGFIHRIWSPQHMDRHDPLGLPRRYWSGVASGKTRRSGKEVPRDPPGAKVPYSSHRRSWVPGAPVPTVSHPSDKPFLPGRRSILHGCQHLTFGWMLEKATDPTAGDVKDLPSSSTPGYGFVEKTRRLHRIHPRTRRHPHASPMATTPTTAADPQCPLIRTLCTRGPPRAHYVKGWSAGPGNPDDPGRAVAPLTYLDGTARDIILCFPNGKISGTAHSPPPKPPTPIAPGWHPSGTTGPPNRRIWISHP